MTKQEKADKPVAPIQSGDVDDSQELLSLGWKWLNNHADGDVCSDRSCVRCKVADALFAVEKRFPKSALAHLTTTQSAPVQLSAVVSRETEEK